jgi:uncharacterized protein YjbJ (UPF0337 family)
MNKHQVKGAAKELAGKTQKTVGRMTGNQSMTAKGMTKQAAGKVQKSYGNAEESARKTTRKTTH